MFHDIQNQLSTKQAFTTGTAVSTDTYDLNAIGTDPSVGRLLAGLFSVTTAAGGTVVATSYKLDVIQSAAANLSSPDVIATGTVLGSACTIDKQFIVPIPQGSITKRYLGLQVTTTGGTAPTVSLSGYIVPQDEIPVNKFFSKVYTTI
jgi:hypothetical protein